MERPKEEDLLAELLERQRQSANIMLFNVEEMEKSMNGKNEENVVRNLIIQSLPNITVNVLNARRIGVKKDVHKRPLCVTLGSREQAIKIIQNKHRLARPVRVDMDRIKKQRTYLQEMKQELKSIVESGKNNKRIRYFNGVPKIVNVNKSSKNGLIFH